ncbi:MAG: MBL fold metallo-hydrolase [Firmicutes bacterium]|nr:MBL fold metallo-hydrolase [Bacillota bacterium]MBR7147237.1 MBL fold metallo-hydrolase [Bacillota bacterium]
MKLKRFVGGNLESNGYVIYQKQGGTAWIIDPGYNPDKYLKFLKENDLKLQGILLTHHHYDHTGGVDKISFETDCKVWIHINDADMYKKPAEFLYDGDVIDVDGEALKVIHTPGHTEGGICLMAEKSRIAFTGDTLFNKEVGRIDLEDGSLKKMERSLRDIINKWPNDITVYPGHGPEATMKFVKEKNPEFLEILAL